MKIIICCPEFALEDPYIARENCPHCGKVVMVSQTFTDDELVENAINKMAFLVKNGAPIDKLIKHRITP